MKRKRDMSPFNIPGIKTKATTQDILEAVLQSDYECRCDEEAIRRLNRYKAGETTSVSSDVAMRNLKSYAKRHPIP